jgi:hypothetical protein
MKNIIGKLDEVWGWEKKFNQVSYVYCLSQVKPKKVNQTLQDEN